MGVAAGCRCCCGGPCCWVVVRLRDSRLLHFRRFKLGEQLGGDFCFFRGQVFDGDEVVVVLCGSFLHGCVACDCVVFVFSRGFQLFEQGDDFSVVLHFLFWRCRGVGLHDFLCGFFPCQCRFVFASGLASSFLGCAVVCGRFGPGFGCGFSSIVLCRFGGSRFLGGCLLGFFHLFGFVLVGGVYFHVFALVFLSDA